MAKQQDLFGFDDVTLSDADKKYSRKVESPIYTPRAGRGNLNECYDIRKYLRLIRKIDESKVSDEQKAFLRYAASRHIVFNYENIADYYAKCDAEMQRLMEDSALVIIDFDEAIEKGYIELNDKMRRLYELEVG